MKKQFSLLAVLFVILLFNGCKKDDDSNSAGNPSIQNQEPLTEGLSV